MNEKLRFILIANLFWLHIANSHGAEICYCPSKPNGTECRNQCLNNPGGVIVFPSPEPDRPGEPVLQKRTPWDLQELEKFRVNIETHRVHLEEFRVDSENDRIDLGVSPPSSEYMRSMEEYRDGIQIYRSNIKEFRRLQGDVN